jgi:hypothetical protein
MSTAAAAPAASKSDLYARLGVSEVIFVEEMERRQADVGDFLLIERGEALHPAKADRLQIRQGTMPETAAAYPLAIRRSTPPKTPRRFLARTQLYLVACLSRLASLAA